MIVKDVNGIEYEVRILEGYNAKESDLDQDEPFELTNEIDEPLTITLRDLMENYTFLDNGSIDDKLIYIGVVTQLKQLGQKEFQGILETPEGSRMDFIIFPATLKKNPIEKGKEYRLVGCCTKQDYQDEDGWHSGSLQFVVERAEELKK